MRVNVVYAIVSQASEVDLECATGSSVVYAVSLRFALEAYLGGDL